MNMGFQLVKAQKSKAKLRVGFSGPSGSGKTWSALLLASGITTLDKVCIIDSENGSASLYSHLGEYNTMIMQAPYSPARYIEAIKACEDAGMELIIIDSTSPEWEGEGGCLQMNELLAKTKFKGNTWSAWSETTPKHQAFISAIVTSKCHIITTARAKTDTIMTEDKKVKKVGLKEIQRDGFEYELTVNFSLDREGNYAIASKDRTSMFINAEPFVITQETGKKLLDWVNDGVEFVQPKVIDKTDIVGKMLSLLEEKETELTKIKLLDIFKVDDLFKIDIEKLQGLVDRLEKLPKRQPKKPKEEEEKVNVEEVSKAIDSQKEEEVKLISNGERHLLALLINGRIKAGVSQEVIYGHIFDNFGVTSIDDIQANDYQSATALISSIK